MHWLEPSVFENKTHSFWGLCFPGHGEELRLPALVPGVALLPHWVNIVIQQHPQSSHIASHHAVVKSEAEAALLDPIAEEKLQPCCILLLANEPTHGHVVLST